MEFTLLWAVLTAVVFAWLGLRIWPERLPPHAFDRLIGAGIAGLVAGRLAVMISQGVNPITNPGDFIVIRAGVSTGAAALVFATTLRWTTRGERSALDALAPAVLLGLAGWHGGCLWRGTCLGAPSDLPWAWALQGSAVTRHPVEIYAALGMALGAWLVSRLGWRVLLRAGAALCLASAVRLATEPLRPSITGGPVWWYAAGVVTGLVAVAFGSALDGRDQRAPT